MSEEDLKNEILQLPCIREKGDMIEYSFVGRVHISREMFDLDPLMSIWHLHGMVEEQTDRLFKEKRELLRQLEQKYFRYRK